MDEALSLAYQTCDEALPTELCVKETASVSPRLEGWDASQSGLVATLKALEAEHSTFDRLLYKNSSQHKRSLHWRHLKEVQRCHREVKSVSAAPTAASFRIMIRTSLDTQRPSTLKQPAREALTFTMLRLLLTSAATEKVQTALVTASRHLAGLLAQTYFMPFALTLLSLLSRSLVLYHQLHVDIAELYQHAARLHPLLPGVKALSHSARSRDFSWLKNVTVPTCIQPRGMLGTKLAKFSSITVASTENTERPCVDDEDLGEVVSGEPPKQQRHSSIHSHKTMRTSKGITKGKLKTRGRPTGLQH